MKNLLFIFSICFSVSCSQQQIITSPLQINAEDNSINQNEKPIEANPVKTPSTSKRQFPLPNVKNYGVYGVSRNSENVDAHGSKLPPYKEVEIYNIYWRNKPAVGEKVTIIPLSFESEPFELPIRKAADAKNEYTESCSSDKNEIFWKIEFEKLNQKEFFEMKPLDVKRAEEYPFDVFVIYPAVKFARQVKQNELTKKMIPDDSSISEVSVAIDLTNDGTPDLIEIRYCCSGRQMSPDDPNCDYSDCGELWKKVGNKWKKTYSWSPC